MHILNATDASLFQAKIGDHISCKICGKVIVVEFVYHRAGVCGGCVRVLGHEYSVAHSGEPAFGFSTSDHIEEYNRRPKPYRKRPIPKRLRGEVLDRDGHRCKRCGCSSGLQADHIFPEYHGGEATLANLQTLCRACNVAKGYRIE